MYVCFGERSEVGDTAYFVLSAKSISVICMVLF